VGRNSSPSPWLEQRGQPRCDSSGASIDTTSQLSYSQHLYHSLGELWLTKGNAAQARECAEACLKLAEPTLSRKNLVKGWRLKGQALLAQGQGEQAEAALSRALTIGQEIGNPPQLWKTYQALGALYEWQADVGRAWAAYRSALEVIEGVAARLQDQELKRTFLAARPVQEIRERLARHGRKDMACDAGRGGKVGRHGLD
jgi:tetratricopeptide (TPR) repeat protein